MAQPIETQLRQRAGELGFCELRITAASLPAETGQRLRDAVGDGHHAGMGWLETTLDRRVSPDAMWQEARSCIMLAMSYAPAMDVMARLEQRSTGVISTYALGRDYHDVIKGRLKTLAGWLAAQTAQDVKVFVDTAPLMEKPLAHRAGLGWQGKHTNLVSREHGSWLFLGAILSAAELSPDQPEDDHCGSCTACLDVCPTNAFPAPYRLDARRCISYLTIEHQGHIDREFRQAMGNRIYGLRRLSGGVPVEQVCRPGARGKACRAGTISSRHRLPVWRHWMTRCSGPCFPARRSSASGATGLCAMS